MSGVFLRLEYARLRDPEKVIITDQSSIPHPFDHCIVLRRRDSNAVVTSGLLRASLPWRRARKALVNWCGEQFGRRGKNWTYHTSYFGFTDYQSAFAMKMRWEGMDLETVAYEES